MYPNLFTVPAFELFGRDVGPFTLPTYGVLLATAFLAGLWIAARQARKSGLDPNRITDLAIYVLIAGLVGAKVLLIVVEWDYYTSNPDRLFSVFRSGGVFYGGLIGALPVAWWYTRRHKLAAWQTVDAAIPGVALGQAIGRLGCLAAGCCYGRPTDLPWGITFTDLYAARNVGVPIDTALHPTQLYESFVTFGIFAALLWIASHKRFHGQVIVSYVALYATARFLIEFVRGDAARGTVFGVLSTSQFIAILMLLGAAAVLPYLMKKQSVVAPPV